MIKNYGFDPKKIVIEPDHYRLGADASLPKTIIRPDRRWSPFLPEYEAQADLYETDGCTVWGTQNCLETLDRAVSEKKSYYAEEFNYLLADISPDGGGDPHAVAESIRKQGVVNQDVMPMPATLDEFADKSRVTPKILSIGEKWLETSAFGHEWVYIGPQAKETRTALIREALQYSPLGVSVSAWTLENGVYIDAGIPNNHWVELVEETPTGWLVFDSYDTSLKTVSFDHDMQFCKRYSLSVTVPPTVPVYPQSCLQKLLRKVLKLKK